MIEQFPRPSGPALTFVVPGPPTPWARHAGKGAGAYTRPAQASYKRSIAQYAWAARSAGGRMGGKPLFAAEIALVLHVRVFLPIPQRIKGDERIAALAGTVRPVTRPDLDNWLKLPMDGLNGIAWADDSQVVSFGTSGKFYGDTPRLEVMVHPLEVSQTMGHANRVGG